MTQPAATSGGGGRGRGGGRREERERGATMSLGTPAIMGELCVCVCVWCEFLPNANLLYGIPATAIWLCTVVISSLCLGVTNQTASSGTKSSVYH